MALFMGCGMIIMGSLLSVRTPHPSLMFNCVLMTILIFQVLLKSSDTLSPVGLSQPTQQPMSSRCVLYSVSRSNILHGCGFC
jgi:hypothetical protein